MSQVSKFYEDYMEFNVKQITHEVKFEQTLMGCIPVLLKFLALYLTLFLALKTSIQP